MVEKPSKHDLKQFVTMNSSRTEKIDSEFYFKKYLNPEFKEECVDRLVDMINKSDD